MKIKDEWKEKLKKDKKSSIYFRNWKKTPKGKFKMYRDSAKKRNHSFELSFEDFIDIVSQNCFYCGNKESIGIDRKNNDLGYTTKNSISCCTECNYFKGNYNFNFFVNKCRQIVKKLS